MVAASATTCFRLFACSSTSQVIVFAFLFTQSSVSSKRPTRFPKMNPTSPDHVMHHPLFFSFRNEKVSNDIHVTHESLQNTSLSCWLYESTSSTSLSNNAPLLLHTTHKNSAGGALTTRPRAPPNFTQNKRQQQTPQRRPLLHTSAARKTNANSHILWRTCSSVSTTVLTRVIYLLVTKHHQDMQQARKATNLKQQTDIARPLSCRRRAPAESKRPQHKNCY